MTTQDTTTNPANTDGFEFLEYATKDPEPMRKLFKGLGFTKVGQHKEKTIEWWKQNDLNFLLNFQSDGFAAEFATEHGPSVCGMAFRVKDAKHAHQYCLSQGAKNFETRDTQWHDSNAIPVIYGIGDNKLYLVDQYQEGNTFYQDYFDLIPGAMDEMRKNQQGLQLLDHVTNNVFRGNMDKWAGFYEDLFNFREIRYFDIEGQLTGLLSRAMTSPCSKIRIPINESRDDDSQIEEYLRDYNGEGIQHIAMTSDDIYKTVEDLRATGMEFMSTPDTYYEGIDKRLSGHGEPIERMKKNRILIDGAPTPEGGRLLQIFTNTVIGPVFFEIIQRKGDEGFGEGNFRALFESIELDQINRGVIKVKTQE